MGNGEERHYILILEIVSSSSKLRPPFGEVRARNHENIIDKLWVHVPKLLFPLEVVTHMHL